MVNYSCPSRATEKYMSDFYRKPKLDELDMPIGKRARLHRLLYANGPGNGKMMVLPIDQGVEHGPINFFVNPESKPPRYQLEMARRGAYSAIAFHYGLAAKYRKDYPEVPLVLKINGKTNIPPDDFAFSSLTANVEDAVRLGADAVGYTLFVGSPAQAEDIQQLTDVRAECDRYGMPLIVWAYPRGEAINTKGGRDHFYAVDYAARLASECGADVVKVNFPKLTFDPGKDGTPPPPYNNLDIDEFEAFRQVVESAGDSFVLVSGGSKTGDDELLRKVEISMKAGATGLIFGRNMWLRPMEDALALTEKVKAIMAKY